MRPDYFSNLLRRLSRGLVASVGLGLLGACASVDSVDPKTGPGLIKSVQAPDVEWLSAAFSSRGAAVRATQSVRWQHFTFPGKKPTTYHAMLHDGRQVIRSEAKNSASMLRQSLRVEPEELGKLKFSWKVPALIQGADLTHRDMDDSPVRLVLAFEGDQSRFSIKNAMLSELVLTLTGEPLPFATLMYVWGNHHEAESVIVSARTDRIRKLVLESGSQQLDRWLDYERDIRTDYEKAYGEAPGALVGIGIMTDSDNTRQQTRAWFGPVSLEAKMVDSAADRAGTPLHSSPLLDPLNPRGR